MNSGNAGKYLWSVGAAFALVVLMWFTDVQEFWFGLTIATIILVMAWVTIIVPQKQAKNWLMTAIAILAIFAFILPVILRLTMHPHVNRAWRTSSIASRLRITSWLYDPSALARQAHEEHCRDENERLTNGGAGSEIGATLSEIERLVAENPNMGLLTTLQKPRAEMTLDEILALQTSDKPVQRYNALQRTLQIQRENATTVYERCLDSGPKPVKVQKEGTAGQNTTTGQGASHKHELKDLDISSDIKKLKEQVPDITLREVGENSKFFLLCVAGIMFVLAVLFAVVRLHTAVKVFWYGMIFVLIVVFALWVAGI